MGVFDILKNGLLKTRNNISEQIDRILTGLGKINNELFDKLEEVLITSDIGINTSLKVIDNLKQRVKDQRETNPALVKEMLREELILLMDNCREPIDVSKSPTFIIVIGVNGVGKTTTIGKLSDAFIKDGKKVILAAGDTFRAAAAEQLQIWGDRTGADVIKNEEGSDPASVIYDAIQSMKAKRADILICDTAGRLHTKKNLMEELKKIFRIIERELPQSRVENLLVLDATTGQNALSQAKTFRDSVMVTGIILTKLDGTAKGGIVAAIASELGIPVKMIGVGEKSGDLQKFIPEDFVNAILG